MQQPILLLTQVQGLGVLHEPEYSIGHRTWSSGGYRGATVAFADTVDPEHAGTSLARFTTGA